jgi:hypothetical protein
MKLFFVALLMTVTAQAETFLFEPYIDAQYSCNYVEGANALMEVDAESAVHAAKLVSSTIGQLMNITCNQDQYQCVHGNGDVEPRVVARQSVDKDLVVIGGRILDAGNRTELAQVGAEFYHRNLRRLPKCRY